MRIRSPFLRCFVIQCHEILENRSRLLLRNFVALSQRRAELAERHVFGFATVFAEAFAAAFAIDIVPEIEFGCRGTVHDR